jgi:N-acetyl-alpha-D-muramate 1-phosphate uridylyltransferase
MKAMIFAAGLGTRLSPYTAQMPKALVPVAGKPMLEHVILRLKAAGIKDFIINVHHFAEQVVEFIHEQSEFGVHIEISHEKDLLLETGGGLKKTAWFFEDGAPFILHNVDVLSTIDLVQMLEYHRSCKALATLAVSKRVSSRYFLFDRMMQLCGWEHTGRNELLISNDPGYELSRFAFSGIHIIDPAIFELIHEEGRFSLVDVYLRLAKDYPFFGFAHIPGDWIDMGRPSDLEKAEAMIREGKFDVFS